MGYADELDSGRLTVWRSVLGRAGEEGLMEAEGALGEAGGGRIVGAEVKCCRKV